MSDWLERVKQEKEELEQKIQKLSSTLDAPHESISELQLQLMKDQYKHMVAYRNILQNRISSVE